MRPAASLLKLATFLVALAGQAPRAAEVVPSRESSDGWTAAVVLSPGGQVTVRRDRGAAGRWFRREVDGSVLLDASQAELEDNVAPTLRSTAAVGELRAVTGGAVDGDPEPSGGKVVLDAKAAQKTKDVVASANALIQLGLVVFVMCLFYMVNYREKHIQDSTWSTLSATISIFCTILIYIALKKFLELVLGEQLTSGGAGIALKGVLFLVFFCLVQKLLLRFLRRPLALAAWGVIGAHFIGFAGMDAFGYALGKGPTKSNPGTYLAGIIATGMFLAIICVLSAKVRERVCLADGVLEECEEDWNHQCLHTENEFIGFILGSLISMWVQFLVTGETPQLHPSPLGKTDLQVALLSSAAIAATLSTIALIAALQRMQWKRGPAAERIVALTKETMSMTSGWLLLFAGEWTFWNMFGNSGFESQAGKVVASTSMALACSTWTLLMLFVMDMMATRAGYGEDSLHDLNNAWVILMGVSWETSFYISIKGVALEWGDKTQQKVVTIALLLGMCVVVLPAWILYIVPRCMHGHGHGHGHGHEDGHGHEHGHEHGQEHGHEKEQGHGRGEGGHDAAEQHEVQQGGHNAAEQHEVQQAGHNAADHH